MSNIDEFKNHRRNVKGQISRIYNVCLSPEVSISEIQVRIEKLEILFKEYENIQSEIDKLATAEQLEAEEAYRIHIEDKYYAAKSTYVRRLNEVEENTATQREDTGSSNSMSIAMQRLVDSQSSMCELIQQLTTNVQSSPQSSDAAQQGSSDEPTHNLRLPQINVPEFDGTYREWIRFRDLFEALVANRPNISNVEKLEYLQTKLKGDALSLLKHLKPTNENYQIAWDLLKKRYDKSEKVKRAYMELMLDQAPMKSSSLCEIKRIYNAINESLNALQALDEPVVHWGSLLLFLFERKLTTEMHVLWCRESEKSTTQSFLDFLEKRISELENMEGNSANAQKTARKDSKSPKRHDAYMAVLSSCPLCSSQHSLYMCDKFKAMNHPDRIKVVRSSNLCFNCLQSGHRAADCKRSTCKVCDMKHNTLLHRATTNNKSSQQASTNQKAVDSPNNPQEQINSISVNAAHNYRESLTLLPTAVVMVRNGCNVLQPCRVLLDSGAQATLISEACVQRLNLKKQHNKTLLHGVGVGSSNHTKGKVVIHISSSSSDKFITTTAYCLPKLTQNLPGFDVYSSKLTFFEGLRLADPDYHGTAPIDMILGADVYAQCVLPDVITHPSGTPSAIATIFGWSIIGKIDHHHNHQQSLVSAHVSVDLDKQLQQFWEIENLPTSTEHFTEEEQAAELHYQQNVKRNSSGRYVVKLPLKDECLRFGESKSSAVKRLHAMEKRFQCNPQLGLEYTKFMHEYISLGHMEPAAVSTDLMYVMPHHAVFKANSTTTKLRVVFDASCKTSNGSSLNDQLLVGPTVQNDLFTLLINFRKYEIGFCADIEKMYRQVLVHPDHRPLQSIVWRDSTSEPIQQYNLTTVTYGTAAAPFLATRTLHQIAIENAATYPQAAKALDQRFYVDDFMSCTTNIATATQLKNDLCQMLSDAGFHLRKWTSNSSEFIADIDYSDRENSSETVIEDSQTIKTLGLSWDTTNDTFKFSISLVSMPDHITKRSILSEIAKIYDPIGWLAPVVISMKIFIQVLWLRGLGWDQQLPDHLLQQWHALHSNINMLKDVQIPRWLQYADEENVELHGFSDSSELAYAAAIYLRVVNGDNIHTHLVAAKTRVAPVKQQSLPRLELCAAHLMVKLLRKVCDALDLPNVRLFGWTDSTIVLSWLSDHPRRWKSFVANRTSYIIDFLPSHQWRHVRSKDNPADLATRGITPSELINSALWWHGPAMLNQLQMPDEQEREAPKETIPEQRRDIIVHSATIEKHMFLFERYSNYTRLVRVTAYVLRFMRNCRAKRQSEDRSTDELSSHNLRDAHDTLVKCAQQSCWPDEIRTLSAGGQLPPRHKLTPLNPFIDERGLLRVGGRIDNANISYDQRHPLIISKEHPLTDLIIRDYHWRYLHAGSRQLQYLLGLRYWVPGIIYAIKRCVYKCTTCMRLRGKPYQQLMGNLPRQRLEPAAAFLNTGVDFAGPLQVRSWKGRGSRTYKCWIALFVCLVTRAIHLEAVTELSTSAFIATLRRFIARRGKPYKMYSDNGTNFIGCNAKLRELHDLLNGAAAQQQIHRELSQQHILWQFSPPSGPHFGGMWEAGVKTTKHHLRRVLGDASVTFEELHTVLCQIESCLNSRPLCIKHHGDTDPLTPGHFLILRSMGSAPEETTLKAKVNYCNRWQYIQRLVQQFWKKWSLEYLSQLQRRDKWSQKLKNLQKDDVVIIKEDNIPPTQWSIGKIVDTHPGSDGLVRVVSVLTQRGVYKRPIVKLCPMFLDV